MSAPYITPHRLAGATRDWTAIGAYRQIDTGEWLRSRIRERDEFNTDLSIIGWGLAAAYLFVVVARLAVML